jgi:hypothetical protein
MVRVKLINKKITAISVSFTIIIKKDRQVKARGGLTTRLDKKGEMLYNVIHTTKSPGIGGLEFFMMGNLAAAGIYLWNFQKMGAEPF